MIAASALDGAWLEAVFDRTFADQRTILRGGFDEPEYLPWADDQPAVIRYRGDHRSSALHEVAHWCIAGFARRQQHDFGYWYAPDGRDAAQQREFLAVEAKPQAIERWFHQVLGWPFFASLDNLAGEDPGDEQRFVAAVDAAWEGWQVRGLPPRAQRFAAALTSAERNPTTR